mmetsp:Transcript_22185/g.50853  ORF Transcript_22185/g.50853 Transcript_22185/m.50853 type:complete len:972 (-) Transcript_22185:244-3159(-)
MYRRTMGIQDSSSSPRQMTRGNSRGSTVMNAATTATKSRMATYGHGLYGTGKSSRQSSKSQLSQLWGLRGAPAQNLPNAGMLPAIKSEEKRRLRMNARGARQRAVAYSHPHSPRRTEVSSAQWREHNANARGRQDVSPGGSGLHRPGSTVFVEFIPDWGMTIPTVGRNAHVRGFYRVPLELLPAFSAKPSIGTPILKVEHVDEVTLVRDATVDAAVLQQEGGGIVNVAAPDDEALADGDTLLLELPTVPAPVPVTVDRPGNWWADEMDIDDDDPQSCPGENLLSVAVTLDQHAAHLDINRAAATAIQRRVRGIIARVTVRRTLLRQRAAAYCIQRLFRGYRSRRISAIIQVSEVALARLEADELEIWGPHAVTTVRDRITWVAAALYVARSERLHRAHAHAATAIQCCARGFLTRALLRRQHSAALILQRQTRVIVARGAQQTITVSPPRSAVLNLTAGEEDTAGDIPYARGSYIRASVYRAKMKRYDSGLERRRRHLSSLRRAREKEAAAIIQCAARRCLAITSMILLQRRKAAVAIQRYARGSAARTLARTLREMQRAMAALRIQRAFRGYHVRCRPVLRRTTTAPSPDNSNGFGRSWTTRKSNASKMLGSNRHDSSKVVGSEPTRGSEVEGGNDNIITTPARDKTSTSRVSSASMVQGSKPWRAMDGDDNSSPAPIMADDIGSTACWERIQRNVRKNQVARKLHQVARKLRELQPYVATYSSVDTRRRLAENYGPSVPWYNADDSILRKMYDPSFKGPQRQYTTSHVDTLQSLRDEFYRQYNDGGTYVIRNQALDITSRVYETIATYIDLDKQYGPKRTDKNLCHHTTTMAILEKADPFPDAVLSSRSFKDSYHKDNELERAIHLRCHIVMSQIRQIRKAFGRVIQGEARALRWGEMVLEAAQGVRSDIGRLCAVYNPSWRHTYSMPCTILPEIVTNYIDIALELATRLVVEERTYRYKTVLAKTNRR